MDVKDMVNQIDEMVLRLSAMRQALISQDAGEPGVPDSIADEAAHGVCHYCKLPLVDGKNNRGDHPKCYKEISRSIAAGEITEQIAMERGWLAPPKSAGRKRAQTPIRNMLAELEAQQIADQIAPQEQKKVAERKGKYKKSSE